MTAYFLWKVLHILSSTVLFGTGLGTAFFMWSTHRSGNIQAIAIAARLTVRADLFFTTPAVFLQPLTGYALMRKMALDFDAPWLQLAIGFYVFTGLCWLPVVWLQWRARDLAQAAVSTGTALPRSYYRYMKIWFFLGWPAFLAVLAIFWLMVAKPPLWS